MNMIYTFHFVFLPIFFCASFAAELYGPYPRIVTENGHLIIYAAEHKNVSLKTSTGGYINLNGENLVLLAQDIEKASNKVKSLTNTFINPFTATVNRLSELVESPDGLVRRIVNLENNITSFSGIPVKNIRNRNVAALNRRVTSLEIKMTRILNLLVKNECASNPCKNGGQCQTIFNGYICNCPSNWEGPMCDTDVNECLRFYGTDLGCQNGATCINSPGSYECMCTAGWYGIHCTRRNQDCNSGSVQELCGYGTCISQNTGVGYKCICDQGWTTDGVHPACTKDVNECESPKPHCSVNPLVPCINVPGSFYCGNCPQGYTGNGYYCTDIDECQSFNGGCSVNPKVQCINTLGSRMCGSCPPGYFGDGITCSYRGVCQINNGGCHPLARCLDNANIGNNYVQCVCPSGYTGSGIGPNGCVSALGPYVDLCTNKPCVHGTCFSYPNGTFYCVCEAGYTGATCNTPLNACSSNPCLNGGTCTNILTGYTCECTTTYTGINCETERQACGGKLTSETGFLKFPPNENTKYDHSVSCSWVIQTDPNKVLNITFSKFNIEESSNCLYDWLQIHDGPNSASHMIGRFCGTEMPNGGRVVSTHNSIYIWFRSDHTVSKPGFALRWTTETPECGDLILVESHGTLKSPGSPGNYPPNRHCEWFLYAPFGKRIQFHFFTLKLGNNPNCSFDYLEIYSGPSVRDALLGRYCNTSHPEPLITSGSTAVIYFHSDASGSDSGFQISYSLIEGIPGCGGTFTLNQGEIVSPSHDEQYPANMDCEYKIRLPDHSRIKLTFLSFSLENSADCKYDYLLIREGGKPDSPLVGRYCGSTLPSSYISSGNEVYIRFFSDYSTNDDGFRIKYEAVCGGRFTDSSGIIESPGYPDVLRSNRNCLYQIYRPLGTAIKLSIQDFQIASNSYPDCHHNFLEIRDGDDQNSTLIGKYCGDIDVIPTEIISTHNFLWLKMQTDSATFAKGFRANYSSVELTCGGIIKQDLGIITSPKHLDQYPPNTKCTWIISAPPGYVIQLTWIQFQLEVGIHCTMDYVAVYDNNTESGMGGLIGRYCGKKLPPMLISSSNMITINFVSDQSVGFDGFIVNYNFLDESKACGGTYFTNSGVIRSPNYPNYYPTNRDCVWVISVPVGQQILLNITDFDLEPYIKCRSDYLEIRNGAYDSSPLIGVFCGKIIPPLIPSHTNNLYIHFHSDGTRSKKGFKIIWDGTTTGCGGTLSSPTGQIISPNYPQPYGQNAMCTWKIVTSAGSYLQLVLLDLDLENHLTCRLDYVEVFDDLDTLAKSFGRFCTETSPTTISTSQNRATVKFRSDVSHQGRGFQLKYTTVCNNELRGYRGVIESLNFPNVYPRNQDCTWTIIAPLGNKINITFSHFDVEENVLFGDKICKFDYIQIEEKASEEEDETEEILLDKYCGGTLPPLISSTKNLVKVHFITDSLVQSSGFRLEWVVDGCGGMLTHPTGRLSTPGFPNGYPANTVCEWTIQVDYGSSIQLTLEKFYIEKSTDCSYDAVEVYSGIDVNYPRLTRVCSIDEKGLVLTSSGNTMFVKFISDSSYNGRGFTASYKTVPIQCGGKFTASTGSIHSRNYPKNYKNNDDCNWLIEVVTHHTIEFSFHEFDLDFSKNCTEDYVKIYDGKNQDALLLGTFCGNVKPNETILSSANSLFVEMKTNSIMTAKGFLANYTVACGSRIIVENSGMIDVQDLYHWECSWTFIAAQPDKHISLSITHLQVSLNCGDPNFKIYDGENTEGPLIGSYCGTKIPPTIVSKGSALHLQLDYAYGAFITATYSVLTTACGGTLTSLDGHFASLGYPNNYPMNSECEWIINIAPGNKVNLNFINFDLIYTENCNSDFVEIREKDAGGKLLGVFCGNEIPNNITHTNSLWIQFRSSDIGTAKGFLAEYSRIHGNELYGTKGEIASPLYPNSFIDTEDIVWRITVDVQSVIMIKFKDFAVDSYSGDDCYLLGLDIYDGYDMFSPLLASLCGWQLPEPIISSSNVVYLKYYTMSYRHSMKFLLEWNQIQRPLNIKDLSKKLPVDGCGSDVIIDLTVLNNYTVKSPGFPYGYAGNLKCEWIFSTEPTKHLTIGFLKVDLEGNNPSCLLDSIKIYTGIDGKPDWKLENVVCLSNATRMQKIHTSNLMKVVFKSDPYINKTGFSALIMPACGGSLHGPNGIIELTNLTTTRKPVVCEWNITVKAGRTVEVTFLEFDIPNTDGNVCNNFILLKNGLYPDSPLLGKGKYCGTEIPHIEATSGNSLYIKYSGTGSAKGFKLAYKELSLACGGHITLTHLYNNTEISSPNYPNIPTPYTECIWIIYAPPGETLQIDFLERFDVTVSKNCTKAGVELRDGGTMLSNLIDVFCENLPGTQKTTDNIMYVRFFTNVADPKNGFKAKVSIASCGGVIRGKIGKLSSPFYPTSQTYSVNTVCTWQIIGPIDHYMIINFNDFSFPYKPNCELGNHLLVKEYLFMGNETIIGTYCGSKLPAQIRTSSNKVTIQMKINQLKPVKGFSLSFNTSQESCGGKIEAESGFITSPGYPISNHYKRICEWLITVPEGRRVTVKMIDFDMGISPHLFNKGLAFFNGHMYRSFISYMLENDNKKLVNSSGNQMMIYYWSSGTSNHRGFKLSFNSDEPTICSGDFNKDSGIIEAPKVNMKTYYCVWQRRPQTDEETYTNRSLSLIINAPVIGRRNMHNCKYATNSISIGTVAEPAVLAELCGTYTSPQIFRTPYPTAKLMVLQGQYQGKINYTIEYKMNPCGGILQSEYGTITSPGFPNRYADTIDCAWLIKVPEGQSIKLNFTFMDLDKSCTKDYINIHNGASPSSPKTGTYCGTTSPSFMQSESNALWVDYHGSSIGTGNGFSFTYEPVVRGCGGIFHDKNRVIQSPNYPKMYPNNIECTWEVRSNEGYHIGLQFIERFQIEDSSNCTNDFIEVWDYKDEDWVSLGRKCGRIQPAAFNSSTNRLKIMFRTNSNLTASGFKATWHFNCGGKFIATETPKYIISPGYPIEYTKNLVCSYEIVAPKKYINVVFEDFHLEEGHSDCQYDNVTIARRKYMRSTWFTFNYMSMNIGTFCGTNKPPPVRQISEISVLFRTDPWINRKGFKLKYFIDSCGGPITNETEINSPMDITGKMQYYSSMDCFWNITAPKDKVVVLKFSFFELEYHRNCQYDYVDIYNGNEADIKERLALLCGNITAHLPVIRSQSNIMLVKMRTDRSNHYRGFRATVLFMYDEKVGCGGTFNLTNKPRRQFILSPDIDHSGIYVPNLDCHWLIVAPPEQIIELTFDRLHLDVCENATENAKCSCDFLQIRDGGGPLSELMAQVCGHDLPSTIISSGNQLWLRMVTDGVGGSTGFKITARKVPSLCGPSTLVVTNEKQLLRSPNYPNPYPNNLRCNWLLKSNSTLNKFEIHFDDLHLQDPNENDECDTDKLEIIDKSTLHTINEGLGENFVFAGPKIYTSQLGVRYSMSAHTYCGTSQPTDYYSVKNEVMITFTSDGDIQKKGFQLDYRIAGCNRNFTAVQGRIKNEGIKNECYIKITVPENYTISLYFQSFLLSGSPNCKLTGLEIRDGNSSSDNLLGNLCGYQIPNPIFSYGNELWLKVKTINRGLGLYDIIYTSTDKGRGCGGVIYNLNGKFTSPMYPLNYRNNSVCRWDISVPRGLQAVLRFSVFDLGPVYTCATDFVELIDVNTVAGEEIVRTRYCAGDNPAVFVGTRNTIALRYTSSVNNGGTGWLAIFGGKELLLN